MIHRLIVLGGYGDLMARYLGPALVELHQAERLPSGFSATAAARNDLSDEAFRGWLGEALDTHAAHRPRQARQEIVRRCAYLRADATDAGDVRRAVAPEEGAALVYLALPPGVFPHAVQALARAGFPPGGTLVVEKPFGTDLGSARELNALVHQCLEEEGVFRIDHFLGMQTVQNVLGLRFANGVLEPLWSRRHVEAVDVVWDETLTLEGRASYDGVGAMADMVQNHLLQLLALVAMEPPASLDARELRDRKAELLRAVRRLSPNEVAERTVRGRYGAGRVEGRPVPAYVEEEGVDPENGTETFAEVSLAVDNERWFRVPFRLRTGKALGRERKEVVIRFRPVARHPFTTPPSPNVLRIALDPEAFALGLSVTAADERFEAEGMELRRELERASLSAYARVLLAALQGDPTLSIRDDEVEESWAIVDPIREAWRSGATPLEEYPAGSEGPPPPE